MMGHEMFNGLEKFIKILAGLAISGIALAILFAILYFTK